MGRTHGDMEWLTGLWGGGYEDFEYFEEEVFLVGTLGVLRRVCGFLRLEPFELLDLACAFCQGGLPYQHGYAASRNDLVRRRREEMGFSRDQLAEDLGLYTWAIEDLETDGEKMEEWPPDHVDDLAEAIRLPVQLLLRFPCPCCHR